MPSAGRWYEHPVHQSKIIQAILTKSSEQPLDEKEVLDVGHAIGKVTGCSDMSTPSGEVSCELGVAFLPYESMEACEQKEDRDAGHRRCGQAQTWPRLLNGT